MESYRSLSRRWYGLGNEDEPSGPDTWACQSWRPSTRRAYGKKLAKLAEYQEQAGTEAVAKVLAEFVAAKAEAGERQATLRGYIAAIRAVEDLEWIDPIVRSRHKRIAQTASKVGRQPYLALGGLCALLVGAVGSEDVEPVALVAVSVLGSLATCGRGGATAPWGCLRPLLAAVLEPQDRGGRMDPTPIVAVGGPISVRALCMGSIKGTAIG